MNSFIKWLLTLLGIAIALLILFSFYDLAYGGKPDEPNPNKPITIVKNNTYNIYRKERINIEGQAEIIFLDTKNTVWSMYYIYGENNKNHTTGVKITIKIGKSYIDRKIKKLEERLKQLESKEEYHMDWDLEPCIIE